MMLTKQDNGQAVPCLTIRRKKLKYKYYGFLKVHEQFSVE